MQKAIHSKEAPNYVTIESAVAGDSDAIYAVLNHYRGYIVFLSTKWFRDDFGEAHNYVDEELRQRLETKLILRVLTFRLNRQ